MTATVIELEDKLKKKSQELLLLQEGELAMQQQLRVRYSEVEHRRPPCID